MRSPYNESNRQFSTKMPIPNPPLPIQNTIFLSPLAGEVSPYVAISLALNTRLPPRQLSTQSSHKKKPPPFGNGFFYSTAVKHPVTANPMANPVYVLPRTDP